MSHAASSFTRLRGVAVVAVTLATAGAAAAPAAAAPRVSDYKLTGAFEIWVEPRAEGASSATGCLPSHPTITYVGSGIGTTSVKGYLHLVAPRKNGFPALLTSLLPGSDDHTAYFRDGAGELDVPTVLAFSGGKGGMTTMNVLGLKPKAKMTVGGYYFYNAKFGSFTFPVVKALPTKSVAYTIVTKPEGACPDDQSQFLAA